MSPRAKSDALDLALLLGVAVAIGTIALWVTP